MTEQIGPRTEESNRFHAMKYRGANEDFEEYGNRCSYGLGDGHHHYFELREQLLTQRFCPGGRVQGSIGASRRTTAFNCYVSGTIEDALYGPGSIMHRLGESAQTSKLGGGIGYDFSTLRPRRWRVKTIESFATGPVSFMEFYNVTGLTIASAGHRRGAQMAILAVWHPDIEEFIGCKRKEGALEGFNISVAVTDEFMEAVEGDKLFWLRFGDERVREVRALDLWNKMMRANWDWAEPGVFFVDNVNRMNNLHYCERITACNPCGEQPLPPFGACLLGSWCLPKYLTPRGMRAHTVANLIDGTTTDVPGYDFDFDRLRADVPAIVRGMDNVIDRTVYPIPEQEAEAKAKRRMGLGVMGLANALEACGHPYGSKGFLEMEAKVLELIRDETYRASVDLAKEKGAFPKFDAERYLQGEFVKTLPDDVRAGIAKHGIRNSHLTSIAPTGTIALCADYVSSGVEPVFAYTTTRPIKTPDGEVVGQFEDYGKRFLGVSGKLSREVTAQEHVDVLVTAQRYVDSAVSKTCNVDGSMPWDDFLGIYRQVHAGRGKGCTTYNRDGKRKALLTEAVGAPPTSDDGLSCAIDEHGTRSCE